MLNPYQIIYICYKVVLPYRIHYNKYKTPCQPPILSFCAFFVKVIYFAVPGFSQNRGSPLNDEFKAKKGSFNANLKNDIA
jgi:hypothetical protein